MATEAFGIDIGGSGAKGAIVDVSTGELISERFKVPTPDPATPDNLAASVVEILDHHGWDGPFGCGLPSVIVNGVVRTAAHIDDSWIGTNAVNLFTETTGHPAYVLNDTDAAGVAEVQLGAGKGVGGTIILLTFGSGIGSAMFRDGILIPNSELGHLELNGGQVTEFSEKPQAGEGWINGAFFVLEAAVEDYIEGDDTLFEREPLERLAKNGELMAYRHEGFWHCMDTYRDKVHLDQMWNQGNAPWKIW